MGAADILLQTERLTLRRFTPRDVTNLVTLDSDPDVIRYTPAYFRDGGRPPSRELVESTILPNILSRYAGDGNFAIWAAEDRNDSTFFGWFQFTPTEIEGEVELGFRLKKALWGKGIATEGARALVERGFRDWGVKRVVASALLANRASIRVLEKAGLTRDHLFDHDPGGPAAAYALDREAYLAGPPEVAC